MSRTGEAARTTEGDMMHRALPLSIAGFLGVTFAVSANIPGAGTASAPEPGTTEPSATTGAVSLSEPATEGFLAPVTADLSGSVTYEADWFTCFGLRATIVGTNGDDVIVGTSRADVIVARAGDDVVRSRGGVDLVCGGVGDDHLFGGRNPNGFTMTRNPPRGDRLSGGKGDDRIADGGGGYRDLLLGGPGNDRLMTASGGYAESRTLKGGPGADRISTHSGSFETSLIGGRGPDTLTSRGHNQFLAGGPGADILTLAGTGDTVLGLDADGNEIRIRGATYVVMIPKDNSGALEVDLAEGTIRRIGGSSGDRIIDLSDPSAPVQFVVYGTDGDDILTGRDGLDAFFPGRGNDRVDDGKRQN